MSFKNFIVAAALTVVTATAANAGVLTTTVTGTISSVNASNGFFNNIQVGQAFTYTSMFDLGTAQLSGQNDVQYYGNTYSYLNASTSAPLLTQLTVNGQTVSFAHPFTNAHAHMADYSRIGYQDYWSTSASGNNYNYNNNYNGYSYEYSNVSASVNAYSMSGAEVDFGKTYTHTFAPSDSANFYANTGHYEYNYNYYYYGYNNWNANLNGKIETFSFNAVQAAPVNDVPEPASLALMAFGLFAVGAARRRKMNR